MDSFNENDVLRKWAEMKNQEFEQNDPWLVYVAEKSRTSCMKCQENHAKRFRSSDDSKPKLPIHPNCKCKYVPLDEATEQMTTMRSIKMFVRGEPKYQSTSLREMYDMFEKGTFEMSTLGTNILSKIDPYGYGLFQNGFSINSIENMLKILEKQCKPGTLGELIIVGHGERNGWFELGDRLYRFEQMTEKQIERLYNLLSPNAIIDLRFCYGIKDKHREKVVQQLANKLRCKIRAYAGQVSQKGKRPGIVKDEEIPWIEKVFYYDPRGKTFYPK